MITLFTAFILFVLATAGVKGFAFTLGIGTLVSLFTAVLFTQAFLGTFGRSKILHSPRALGAARAATSAGTSTSRGASKWFFSISGTILAIGAISLATKQLNLGIDFTSGHAGQGEPPEGGHASTRCAPRSTTRRPGTASSAEIQSMTNAELAPNAFQIQGKIPLGEVNRRSRTRSSEFGLRGGTQASTSRSVGPTFGAQVARSALIAIIFSLLVISAYMAIRFEAKYAIPVLIALAARHPDHRRACTR